LAYRTISRIAALGIAVALFAGTPQAGAQTPPQTGAQMQQPDAIIRNFSGTLLRVMRDAKTLRFAGRRDLLQKEIAAAYHLPVMARIAVGAYWRKLSPAQQDRLVADFSRLTIATYANRFNDWTGEKFEMRGTDKVRDKTVLVKTAIVRPGKPAVEINYLMRRFQAGWKVIDIFLKESYSELATKRSEYSSILRRQGFDALIGQIGEKIAQYERSPN
jgi:phospholipid transport system substrate-binding protein